MSGDPVDDVPPRAVHHGIPLLPLYTYSEGGLLEWYCVEKRQFVSY